MLYWAHGCPTDGQRYVTIGDLPTGDLPTIGALMAPTPFPTVCPFRIALMLTHARGIALKLFPLVR